MENTQITRYRGGTRSIFTDMPLHLLVEGARKYATKRAYLASLGIRKRYNMGLDNRLAKEKISHKDLWPHSWANALRFPEQHYSLDLQNDTLAYFYGLAVSDGSLRLSTRNRGNLTIELNVRDADVLHKLLQLVPWKGSYRERSRVTNFGPITTASARWCSLDLRSQLLDQGFVPGKKSDACKPPIGSYEKQAFWRGMIDGDGSVGTTADGSPFVSLTTESAAVAEEYKSFIEEVVGERPDSNPNTRDSVYNIMMSRTKAIQMIRMLYPGTISLTRKRRAARLALEHWSRLTESKS